VLVDMLSDMIIYLLWLFLPVGFHAHRVVLEERVKEGTTLRGIIG